MTVTVYHAFAFGLVGSLAVELILYLQALGPHGGVPRKYKTKAFWIPRLLLAIVAGMVAVIYYAESLHPALYLYLGVATPAMITRVSRSAEEESGQTE